LTKLRQGTVRDAWWLAVRARADVAAVASLTDANAAMMQRASA